MTRSDRNLIELYFWQHTEDNVSVAFSSNCVNKVAGMRGTHLRLDQMTTAVSTGPMNNDLEMMRQ